MKSLLLFPFEPFPRIQVNQKRGKESSWHAMRAIFHTKAETKKAKDYRMLVKPSTPSYALPSLFCLSFSPLANSAPTPSAYTSAALVAPTLSANLTLRFQAERRRQLA